MALTLDQIEWLHDNGKMPDWAYYQQNGKSATLNLHEQSKKFKEYLDQREMERKEAIRSKEKLDKETEKQIKKDIDQAIQKGLAEVLRELNK